jgi:class 3 adenylate cyclase
VLLNAATYTAACQRMPVNAEALPPVAVRGKQETVAVYALREE